MDSPQKKKANKKTMIIAAVVVGLVVIAGGTYALLATMMHDKSKDQATNKNVPAKVAPEVIQQNLKTANDTSKQESDAYTKAQTAVNEKQTKLVN